jgi:hypothetical protein
MLPPPASSPLLVAASGRVVDTPESVPCCEVPVGLLDDEQANTSADAETMTDAVRMKLRMSGKLPEVRTLSRKMFVIG